MKKTVRVLAVLLTLLLSLAPMSSAETLTTDDRLQQARHYVDAGLLDDALFALELAEALEPGTETVFDARLNVLIAAGRHDEANTLIDGALCTSPLNVALYLKRARVSLGMDDATGAREALQRGMVAAGGDAAFAAQYGAEAEDVIWAVADALVAARDNEGAMRLYRMRPPTDGANPLYDKTLQRVTGTRPPVEIHPGIEDDAFDQALAEDRLALKPAEITITIDFDQLAEEATRVNAALALYDDEDRMMDMPDERPVQTVYTQPIDAFYDESYYLSLSPEAGKLLIIQDEMPMIYDLANQAMKVIAPADGIDPEYYELRLYRLLAQVEDSAVCWSPDERYVALSHPRLVVMMAQFGCNLLLIDTEAGTIKPIVSNLPANVRLSAMGDEFVGAPFRAVFDEHAPVLYYESYGAMEGEDGRKNALRAYDCETGEVRLIASPDAAATTSDPQMWMTPLGIAQTYAHNQLSQGYGLAFYTLDGSVTRVAAPNSDAYDRGQRGERLIDWKGDRGLLLSQWLYEESETRGAHGALIAFSLDELSDKLFDEGTGILPGADAQHRLVQYSLTESADSTSDAYLQLMVGNLLVPYNAALSPDGRYLLMAAQDPQHVASLYVHDYDTGVTGKLDLSALGELGPNALALAQTPINRYHRGLRWLNNNKLLVDIDGQYGIYELAIG